VYSVQSAVCSVQCTVCSVQCTVCSVQCTVYSAQCTVYSVQCTVYISQCVAAQSQCPEGTASSMEQLSFHQMQVKRFPSALSKPTIAIQSFSDRGARIVRFSCSLLEHNIGSAISSGNMATMRYFPFQFDMHCALSNRQLSGDVGTPAQTLFTTVLLPKGTS